MHACMHACIHTHRAPYIQYISVSVYWGWVRCPRSPYTWNVCRPIRSKGRFWLFKFVNKVHFTENYSEFHETKDIFENCINWWLIWDVLICVIAKNSPRGALKACKAEVFCFFLQNIFEFYITVWKWIFEKICLIITWSDSVESCFICYHWYTNSSIFHTATEPLVGGTVAKVAKTKFSVPNRL